MTENEKTIEQIRGQIKGLNMARIRVWGIGYDDDETGLMMREFLNEEIRLLKEILDLNDESVGAK